MSRKVFPDFELIKNMRSNLGYDQDWVALAADISVRTYQRVEAGHGCSMDSLKGIASALDCNHTELMPKTEKVEILENTDTYDESWLRLGAQFIWGGLFLPPTALIIFMKYTSILLAILLLLTYLHVIPGHEILAELYAEHIRVAAEYNSSEIKPEMHPHEVHAWQAVRHIGTGYLFFAIWMFLPSGIAYASSFRDFQLLVWNPITTKTAKLITKIKEKLNRTL